MNIYNLFIEFEILYLYKEMNNYDNINYKTNFDLHYNFYLFLCYLDISQTPNTNFVFQTMYDIV